MTNNTRSDLQQAQEPVQVNQTLSVCDDSNELSDKELASVNGGAGLKKKGLLGLDLLGLV